MAGFPSPFGADDDDVFDAYDEFRPAHLPEPGEFLAGHAVLTGDDHVAFHETTRDLFEERTVYDMTFGYNLARLNLDGRHENAGFRYAEETEDPSVLRAEFNPTTPFCPQTSTLTVGAFRAWNGLAGRHDYRLVRVRAAGMHHRSDEINDRLRSLEQEYRETGSLDESGAAVDAGTITAGTPPGDDDPDAPF